MSPPGQVWGRLHGNLCRIFQIYNHFKIQSLKYGVRNNPPFFGAVNLVPSYLWHTRPSFTACVTPYMSSPLHFVAPFPSGALANCCQFSSPPSSMKWSTFFLYPVLWVFWFLCFLVYNWQFDKLILDDVMRCLTLENTPLGDRSSILSILHPLIWCLIWCPAWARSVI